MFITKSAIKSRVKALLVAGYNHGIINDRVVSFWFDFLKLRSV